MWKNLAPCCFAFLCWPLAVLAQSPPENSKTDAPPHFITVPDGTPVFLRFAQPLVGVPQYKTASAVDHAKKGDLVQLVVAQNVRVNGVLVIGKGSLAQATVMKAEVPDPAGGYGFSKYGNRPSEDSGLELRFDWIKSIDGQEIPIRQKQKGKNSGKFQVVLLSSHGGNRLLIGFSWDRRSWSDAMRKMNEVYTHRQWTVVPTGTRAKAFVHGDVNLNAEKVNAAVAELPAPNPTATVTLYREKGPKDQRAEVVCDEKELCALADWQYFAVEMNPGKHSCRIEKGNPFSFTAAAGEEIYLRLQYGAISGKWEISSADSAAAEDAITFSEPAVPNAAQPPATL